MNRKLFLVMVFVAAFCGFSYAIDQNVMVDDALQNFSKTIENVSGIKTIAIYPFEYSASVKIRNVEDKIILKITESGKFRVIDRKDIEVLLKEQALALSGVVENSKMSELGKLKGADAFLFGKVNVIGNRLIINLTLKEVATGAILWSSELKGVDYTSVTIGSGVRLGQYKATSSVQVNNDPTERGTQNEDDGIYVSYLFNFVQRLYKSQNFSFGVDAIFSLGILPINRVSEDLLNGYFLSSTIQWRDYNLTVIPIVRAHLAKMLNPKGEDYFVFYGGIGFSTDYIQLVGTTDTLTGAATDSVTTKYDSGIIQNHSKGGFAYKVGFEIIFSPKFSVFMEGYNLPKETMSYDDIAAGGLIKENVEYKAGNYYSIGAKYYFKTF